MAHYEQRSKNTYRLVVDVGLDTNHKRVRKRKTIKLSETLTPAQREKELNRQLILFQEEVSGGNYLDGENLTFAEFTKNWLKDYAEIKLTPTTLVAYKQKLNDRILPALGHIIISKLQPTHLLKFYHNLHEPSVRLDSKYVPVEKFVDIIKTYTNKQLIELSGISSKSCNRLKKGLVTNYEIAQKVCKSLNLSINKMFKPTNVKTLSEKTIQNHMGIICSILSTALKWNVIKDNPMLRIDMKKVQKQKAKYYDDKQVTQMLQANGNYII